MIRSIFAFLSVVLVSCLTYLNGFVITWSALMDWLMTQIMHLIMLFALDRRIYTLSNSSFWYSRFRVHCSKLILRVFWNAFWSDGLNKYHFHILYKMMCQLYNLLQLLVLHSVLSHKDYLIVCIKAVSFSISWRSRNVLFSTKKKIELKSSAIEICFYVE